MKSGEDAGLGCGMRRVREQRGGRSGADEQEWPWVTSPLGPEAMGRVRAFTQVEVRSPGGVSSREGHAPTHIFKALL